MATRDIKTRLTLDGEKEFRKQIASINQELRLGNAQLKETAAAYDLNGNAQDRLTANSRILREQLNAQNRIVADFEERLRQAKQATDLSAEGLRNYEIALTNARTKQKQLEKQVEDTDRELEELGRDSRRAGSQLEDNLGDAADDVSNRFERMVSDINDSLTDIRSMQGVSLAVDLVRGAWDFGQQAYQWAQGYAEENMRTAMTQFNVEAAGGDWTQTSRMAIEYASIFGDRDAALEAINALVSVGYTGESLETIAKYIGGGAIEHRGDLNIESIASDLAKTVTTGNLEGQLADLLKYATAGTTLTEEYIREQLAEARVEDVKEGSNRNVMAAVEAYLRDAGFDKTFENFTDQNQDMIDAAVAAGTLKQELADLARIVNEIFTPGIQLAAEGVKWLNEELQPWNPDYSEQPMTEEQKEKTGYDPKKYVQPDPNYTPSNVPIRKLTDAEEKITELLTFPIFGAGRAGGETIPGQPTSAKLTQAQRDAMMLASGQSNYAASLFVKPLETVAKEVDAQLAETEKTAAEGGSKIGANLWAGMQGQTAGLIAIAQQQRALLEAVWNDPITPTVVVSYGTAPGATGGKPNLPTLPSNLNVTVELDKRKLGQTIVPLVDQALGGAAGADVDKIY